METRRRLRVYVAASREVAGYADKVAKMLAERGIEVTSKWHTGQTKIVDPTDPDVRTTIVCDNLSDLQEADAVLAIMTEGSPKATYAEIGYALAEGHAVFWLGPSDGEPDPLACIFDAHPLVMRDDSLESILRQIVSLDQIPLLQRQATLFAEPVQAAHRLWALVAWRKEGLRKARERGDATDIKDWFEISIIGPTKNKMPPERARVNNSVLTWFDLVLNLVAMQMLDAEQAKQAMSALSDGALN